MKQTIKENLHPYIHDMFLPWLSVMHINCTDLLFAEVSQASEVSRGVTNITQPGKGPGGARGL